MKMPTAQAELGASPVAQLRRASSLLAESNAAVDYALRHGFELTARVLTNSPAVTARTDIAVTDLGMVMDGPRLKRLAVALDSACRNVYRAVLHDTNDCHVAILASRALLALQIELAKRIAIELAQPVEPIGWVELKLGGGAEKTVDVDWSRVLSGSTFELMPRVLIEPPQQSKAVYSQQNASLLERLRFESIGSIGYRLLSLVHEKAGHLRRGREFLVWRENSLLKEAAFALSLQGYSVSRLRPALQAGDAGDVSIAVFEAPFKQALRDVSRAFDLKDNLDSFLPEALARLQTQLKQFRQFALAASVEVEGRRQRPLAVLTNAKTFPEGLALHSACRKHGIPVFGFQHAVTVEFHEGHKHVASGWDNLACDHLFAYAPETRVVLDASPYRIAQVHVVGAPSELSAAGHLRRPAKTNGVPPVFYVSTALYSGSQQLAAMKGVPDSDKARREIAIVQHALAHSSHEVLYKPYPAVRYSDPDPVVEEARRHRNIRVFADAIDLRYMLHKARLIITSRATSTLSWCMSSGRPLIYIDHPYDLPLTAEARDALAKAVFLVAWDGGSGLAELRAMLQRDLQDIEGEYAAKRSSREAFLDRFVGSRAHRAGAGAARVIRKTISGQGA